MTQKNIPFSKGEENRFGLGMGMMRGRYLRKGFAWIALATAVLVPVSAGARKIRTKLPVEKKSDGASDKDGRAITRMERDSTAGWEEMARKVRFYGFDKTAGSALESVFVVNGLDSTLRKMEIEVNYLDMKGRQLHRQTYCIDCLIPAGETKRIDYKSWDAQKSFYYHRSAKPKRQATPFDVRISLKSMEF